MRERCDEDGVPEGGCEREVCLGVEGEWCALE